jgi:hypothetical protein
MKKFLFFALLISTLTISAQSLRPAVSYTYLFDRKPDFPEVGLHELTLNLNLLYEISPNFNLGLQYLGIRTHGSAYTYSEEWRKFFMAGMLVQYDMLPRNKIELFPEVSINYGNYCPCGQFDPFEHAGIFYFGYGFGADIPLSKRLFIDTGLHFYRPISDLSQFNGVYAYGGYILGLSYRLL